LIGGVLRAGVVSDDVWAVIEPVLPRRGGRPRPAVERSPAQVGRHRVAVEDRVAVAASAGAIRGVAVGVGTAPPLVDPMAPTRVMFTAVRLHAAARAAASAGPTAELLSVDATIVRAHQHAAGGRFHLSTRTGGSVERQESARRTR
jgi:putative transposase